MLLGCSKGKISERYELRDVVVRKEIRKMVCEEGDEVTDMLCVDTWLVLVVGIRLVVGIEISELVEVGV